MPKFKKICLNLAIEQVENYITELKPKNYEDIKAATDNISKAAIGAYLSVHSVGETLDFINKLAHMTVSDISRNISIPYDYQSKLNQIH
jgi:ABC-type lipopolysaccharide export system ATPase subunit